MSKLQCAVENAGYEDVAQYVDVCSKLHAGEAGEALVGLRHNSECVYATSGSLLDGRVTRCDLLCLRLHCATAFVDKLCNSFPHRRWSC